MDTDKTYMFEEMPIPRAILSLVAPTVAGSLVTIIYNLADTYFVGLLNDPVETAAVTLISVLLLLFNAVNNLFGVGTSSLMSRALGRKDYETCSRSSATGFYGALCSGFVFMLVVTVFRTRILYLIGADEVTFDAAYRYMFWAVNIGVVPAIMNVVMSYMVKSEGEIVHATIGTISGAILNIILDPFFVLPQFLNMGAAGAGLATCISNCVAFGYFLVYVLFLKKGKTIVCLDIKKIDLSKIILGSICAVGIPAAIQNLLNVVSQIILNNFAAGFGAQAISAVGISHRLNTIPFMVALGASQGVMPLISYNYASGNIKRMKEAVFYSLKMVAGSLTLMSLIYMAFSGPLVGFFIMNEEVVAIGRVILRAMAIALPFIGVDFTIVGVLQATGYGRISLFFALSRKLVLEIPLLIILNKLFPLYGLGYAQPIGEIALSIIAVFVLNRLFKEWDDRAAKLS